MSGGFHNLSKDRVVAAFKRAGWVVREGGSHTVLTKPDSPVILTIPRHRTVKKGLLLKQIKQAGLTQEQFLTLYR